MSPVREWKDIESYVYKTDVSARVVELIYRHINQWHNVRVVKPSTSEVSFSAQCKFTNGVGVLDDGWATRSDVENGLAHWEVELVDGG